MAVTVEKYNVKYLRMKPEVTQIYNDLEEYRDWVRLQYPQVAFNEADLYKNSSPLWQKFLKSKNRPVHNKK
jgi:hypothetical protein